MCLTELCHSSDPAPSGFSLPVKHDPPSTYDPHIKPTDAQTTCSNSKEVETALVEPKPAPQAAPQTAPSEVSWMSLAMEKTRSLQQLFTSRFPRDFTGTQAAARPQAQAQTTNQTEAPTAAQMQTQSLKAQQSTTPPEAANPPSADAAKAESRSQAHTVRPSLVLVQQKTSTTSPVQSNPSREAQPSKETSEPQSHPTAAQSASPSVQTNPRTTQTPVQFSLTGTSSQSAQGSVTQSLAQSYLSSGQQQQQQQPPWSSRTGLHSANQLKSTTSAPSPVSTSSSATPSSPAVSASGRGEKEAAVQEKQGALQSGTRPVWAGSVSERAAFLEKRAEWTTTPGTKGVCGTSL